MPLHTPGPWTARLAYAIPDGAVVSPIGCVIDSDLSNPGQSMANARLIAAAPDLLDQLKAAVARVSVANAEGDPILSAWLPDALAVIAKAEGA